ncbi:GlgB N-terminal domain-containing protein, partial [Brachybacterium sp.]|uniref:GlgB N-terminal domain-containing protein n=1 Tax=Brachybacterium sp. TaxID=1891286 RepID=UPI002F0145FF
MTEIPDRSRASRPSAPAATGAAGVPNAPDGAPAGSPAVGGPVGGSPAVRATVMPLGEHELGATATGSYHEPHSVLGAHEYEGRVTVRTLKPLAQEVAVVLPDGGVHTME